MVASLIGAWCVTTVVATLCFLMSLASAADSAAAPSPAALVEYAAAPHRGADSVKRAKSGWAASHDAYRSQPEPGVLTGTLEPEATSGTGMNRPRIEPASSIGQARETSISSRTYELSGDYVPGSHDAVTAPDRKTPRFILLSWPQRSSFTLTEADEANRNAIFASNELAITDVRMPVDGIRAHFRPLLEISLGAYKLPISLYVPNSQTNWPGR